MKRLEILKPIPKLANFPGTIAEVHDEEKALQYIRSGHAILVPETEGENSDLPEDFPAKAILEKNGIESISDVKNGLGSITSISGIGKKTAKDIKDYLDKINE